MDSHGLQGFVPWMACAGIALYIQIKGRRRAFRDCGLEPPEWKPWQGFIEFLQDPLQCLRELLRPQLPPDTVMELPLSKQLYIAYNGSLANFVASFVLLTVLVTFLISSLDVTSGKVSVELFDAVRAASVQAVVALLVAYAFWRWREDACAFLGPIASIWLIAFLTWHACGCSVSTSSVDSVSPLATNLDTVALRDAIYRLQFVNVVVGALFALPLEPLPGADAWGALIGRIHPILVKPFYVVSRIAFLLLLIAEGMTISGAMHT